MINNYASKPEDIIACIGPTIRSCHFEVDADVKDMFEKAFKASQITELGEVKQGKQKYYINTVLANIIMMKELGLKMKILLIVEFAVFVKKVLLILIEYAEKMLEEVLA